MTVEQLDKMEYLNRAYRTAKKITALQEVKRQRTATRTVKYNHFCGGRGSRKAADDNFIQTARIEEKLTDSRRELDRQLDELTEIILNIPETDIKAVMICRYMLFMTYTETAKALDYDNQKTPKRKVNVALQYIPAQNEQERPLEKAI